MSSKKGALSNLKKEFIALILGTVCVFLTFTICIQMKTVEEMTQEVGSSLRDNSQLKDEYVKWKGLHNTLYKQLEQLENDLEKIRSDASQGNRYDRMLEEEIIKNNVLLGLTDVKGSGIRIILDDNREITPNETLNISNYLVHEEDLLSIVNELFNSGADAISINGHRVVNATSIYCDGNIIRVNNEKTSVPITINAIGYPENLEYALIRPGGYVAIMKEQGVNVSIEKLETIKIPKYNGVFSYEHIER